MANAGLCILIYPKIADLTDLSKPDLTVIDAYRVLMDNGPSGGNLDDVALKKTVIVSAGPVLADAYACTLASTDPFSIGYITQAAKKNLGSYDIAKATIKRINTNP